MDLYQRPPIASHPSSRHVHASSSSSATTSAQVGDLPLRSPRLPPSPRTSSKQFSRSIVPPRLNSNRSDPPRTPSPKRDRKGKGKQAVRPATARHIRSGSDITEEEEDGRRHSHGLSWNTTTRDSVVDNLLFSLDSMPHGDFGDGDFETSADADRTRFLSELSTNGFQMSMPSRSRGHTQSSSTSDLTDSSASNFATPKGRRSNSTTDFQQKTPPKKNGLGITKGITEGEQESKSIAERRSEDKGHPGLAQVPSRLATSTRSMSTESMRREEAASVLTRGRPVPSVHSKYESPTDAAAPEPFIAGGPRNMQNPTASGPVYVNPAPPKTPKTTTGGSTIRKVTTQPDLRSVNNSDNHLVPQVIRDQAAEFVRTSSMLESAGLVPPAVPERIAPSPDPSRRRDHSPLKEKPGFFKRVFGGSSRVVSNPMERPLSKQVSAATLANDQSESRKGSLSQASPVVPPGTAKGDSKQTPSASTTSHPPLSLNKKPSFFRRRKKSFNENVPPPMPANAAITQADLMKKAHEPAPSISSLRKEMAPFLSVDTNGSRPPTANSRAEDSDNPDLFHTGYTADAPLTLNTRSPLSREQTVKPQDSPTKIKVKKRTMDALITTSPVVRPAKVRSVSAATSTSTLREHKRERSAVSPLSSSRSEVFHDTFENNGDSTSIRDVSAVQSSEDLRDFSAGTNVSLSMDDPLWAGVARRPSSPEKRLGRVVLKDDKDFVVSPVSSPNLSKKGSQSEMLLPAVQVEGTSIPRSVTDPAIIAVPSPTIQVPLEMVDEGAEYRERARRIFDGNEEDVPKLDAAAWMGERSTLSSRTLTAYMELFDFAGMNILAALRMLCGKLVLRGETQQFDRIINALSSRWVQCNPNHGFKAQDVVHTLCYSLILLNTDMYLADITEKMSRSAYVKNTLPTIKRVVLDAAPTSFDDTLKPMAHNLRPGMPWTDSSTSSMSGASSNITSGPTSPMPDTPRSGTPNGENIRRLSIRPGMSRNDSEGPVTPDSATGFGINALVNTPGPNFLRGWESEIETVLKAFFASIKAEKLPLHGAVMTDLPLGNRNLSVVDLHNTVQRTGSIISKAPSENQSYRPKNDLRSMTMRWGANRNVRNNGRPKPYAASTIASSRTSFDDNTSGFWSPSAQSSKFSFGKTLTSPSVGSFGHYVDPYKHSIGFANALSEAIIREETSPGGLSGDNDSFVVPGGLLEDESLALEGAPWAKEGLVKHKHHLETPDRKAKERSWNDCFAVISKGKLTLFAFGQKPSTSSNTLKKSFTKSGKAASVSGSTTVGGGDWMENAEQLESFILRQTIASVLPPPGYSKVRPHVWALSLPSGAVHLFQVGTPDIAKEFMSAANYWSARLSKEPLAGGVSNVEYGWSDRVINTALLPADLREGGASSGPPVSLHNHTGPGGHAHTLSTDRSRSSLQSSIRGSMDTGSRSVANTKARLPGDRVQLNEWIPPTQSLMASALMEVDQLRALKAYVEGEEEELRRHMGLKGGIELAYSPRSANFGKAMGNWQRKSDYLLREIVKFRTYCDALGKAREAREEVLKRRGAANGASPVVGGGGGGSGGVSPVVG
ncbi:unnamed protein product [Zymoseptoria tritici ST99CH_1A5]|uniref:SEC7 domain-containing protein n=1 Tax=Zymoseptoria tritici ST99CH_1A5 TaxID=1276529 RepID=A0A1Y6M0A6_ZYMTR|nr:unnamed protein product [Zymoseptoria tritici ST99CH_1A5]